MKIADIQIQQEHLALTRPYTIAYKTVSDVENCFVKVILDNGIIGLGASNPSKQVVGETVSDVVRLLKEKASRFIGADIRELAKLWHDLEDDFSQSPGSMAALDIAFHDAFTQYLDIPLARFLGQQHISLPTSITIGIKNVAETIEEAEEYQGRGFRILKVKLGHSLEEDIERLVKLRERFGKSMGIRVDANQGYTIEQLLDFWQRILPLDIELIEQPLKADVIEPMRDLPEGLRLKIAADESLVNVRDAFRLSQPSPATGIFNIKLMKCGGIHQGLRIAEQARLAGCELMWGCNDESIISISAALHAAFACKHTRYLDLDGSLDLARDLVQGGFVIENGEMGLAGGNGLGVRAI
ncbi:MAG: dipeptide epimerase [Bacteroidota bacterium]